MCTVWSKIFGKYLYANFWKFSDAQSILISICLITTIDCVFFFFYLSNCYLYSTYSLARIKIKVDSIHIISSIQDFKGEMRQGQDMVNNATQQGERVMATTAPRGQEAIVKEIQNLKDDWNTFASSVNEMESNLESCIGNWDDLDEEYQRFLQWIDRMDSRIKGLMENKPDEQRKQQQLMEGEVISFIIIIITVYW